MDMRCFSCDLPLAHLQAAYFERITSGVHATAALHSIGIDRMCCRSHFVCYPLQLQDTLVTMSTKEPRATTGGPLKLMFENCSRRLVSTG